eukprot:c12978_g1_i1 orf=2-778(-)
MAVTLSGVPKFTKSEEIQDSFAADKNIAAQEALKKRAERAPSYALTRNTPFPRPNQIEANNAPSSMRGPGPSQPSVSRVMAVAVQPYTYVPAQAVGTITGDNRDLSVAAGGYMLPMTLRQPSSIRGGQWPQSQLSAGVLPHPNRPTGGILPEGARLPIGFVPTSVPMMPAGYKPILRAAPNQIPRPMPSPVQQQLWMRMYSNQAARGMPGPRATGGNAQARAAGQHVQGLFAGNLQTQMAAKSSTVGGGGQAAATPPIK